MAKKQNFSHITAQEALEAIADNLNADNLPYELLRIFCGYGDASLQRVRDGRDNKSRDPQTILIKDKFVYRPSSKGTEPLAIIQALRNNASITRHNPRLYITSDGKALIAYDPKDEDFYEGSLETLWRDFEFFKPLAGIEKFRNYEEAEADVKTAELMAKLYDDICRYNDFRDPEVSHCINVFMSRLLFCFFAEDTGLFKQDQFTKAIEDNTAIDGSDLAEFIDRIFVILSTNDKNLREQQSNKIISDFPYVNGGLFSERYAIPQLSRRARLLMIQCGKFQWSEINPDIFGSMTQAIVSPEDRAELGIHYTSVPNIMKVIQPLFLDDLAAEYLRCRNDAKALNALLVRMGKIKFFDPACGSGNFLIISYKRVRELEIEIWKRLFELQATAIPFTNIQLTQFYGIEIDEYACDTAKLSLWLAEHQMNNKFREELGTAPNPLPLRASGHIVCGNACTIDWNTVCPHTTEEEVYVMGNPPYYGSKKQTDEQKADMLMALSELRDKKGLDYIAGWFWKGAIYIKGTKARYAFVTTNSICQGEQVDMLWKPILVKGLTIAFARTSFKWSNNAKNNAVVACVIIGVTNDFSGQRRFFNESSQTELKVNNINPYLSVGENIIVRKENTSLCGMPPVYFGSMPRDGGFLNFDESFKEKLLLEYPSSKSFIKKYIGAQELLQGGMRYCLWIEEPEKALAYSIPPIANLLSQVKVDREKSDAESTREYAKRPYMFVQRSYQKKESIIIPGVSSERREYIPMGYMDENTVISNSAFAIYDVEYWLFGLLTSKIHNVWVRAVAGSLENRIRYAATLCYNTFPFPKMSNTQRNELSALAKEILLVRAEHSEMTLGDMYNPENFPDDLRAAHHALDLAVERCYREKPFESDEERLEFLFKQYIKLTTDKSTLWRT
ncbi:MAG: class I SAM-dependent DNA methyltransferase [Bacteroidales bacterium]|nr:class I SAM-dependent DNA methyltransferase [Bacteroidales bacterium]